MVERLCPLTTNLSSERKVSPRTVQGLVNNVTGSSLFGNF